jgi:uncharacterized protein (TIGR03085 family)
MTERFASGERNVLAQTLLDAGPDAPTLCDGWKSRDLAAHLVLRERKPLAAAGIMLKPFAGLNRRVQDRLAARDYAALVAKFRVPAALSPARIGGLDEAMNFAEFFIHTEDVRRATPGWTPRELPGPFVDALFKGVRRSAQFQGRKLPGTIVVQAPGREPFTVGAGGDRVELSGAPGELMLFFVGRGKAADVTLSGPDAAVDQLRHARLGI